jgi:hypothetical protein
MRQVGLRPDAIRFSCPDLHPGGCTWSPALGAFIVSSQKQGKLVLVEMDGRCVDLLDHPLLITSTAVHERDGKAYVAVGHRGINGRSLSPRKSPGDDTIHRIGRVCVFDIAGRRLVDSHDLTPLLRGGHVILPDDLAVAEDGSVYVTDVCRPVVYRIPPAGHGSPHIFLRDERLGGEAGEAGNAGRIGGLSILPDGAMVVSCDAGQLFKAPLGNPHEFRPIGIPHPFPGAACMTVGPEGHLYLAAHAADGKPGTAIWRLASDDGFDSVRVVGTDRHGEEDRTVALAVAQHRVWAIDGRSVESLKPDVADYRIAPFTP